MSHSSCNLIQSPCIRKCCLDDKDVCLGCFRTLDEITGWTSYSEDEKLKVLAHCTRRKQQHDQKYKGN